jgi:hypothetical protein
VGRSLDRDRLRQWINSISERSSFCHVNLGTMFNFNIFLVYF